MTMGTIAIREIKASDSLDYLWMEHLLTESFPSDEYRDLTQLRDYTDTLDIFHCCVIEKEGTPVGLLNYWDFGAWVYVEHFATLPSLRGTGIGARVLSLFNESGTTVLEVELPTDEMSCRRIGFYRRSGFEVMDGEYIQPAYKPGSSPLPMKIMSRGHSYATSFEDIVHTLHSKVYGLNHFTESTPSIADI